jgi:hypothetical protein
LTDADADHKGAIGRLTGVNRELFDELMATGAVVCGRGTFEPAGGWGGDHHDGVPIFILTRHDPADLRQWPLVTYSNDVTTAMTRAKEAAGDKNVLVHGAGTAQLALAAGVLSALPGPGVTDPVATAKAIIDANLYMVLGTAGEGRSPVGLPRLLRAYRLSRVRLGLAAGDSPFAQSRRAT